MTYFGTPATNCKRCGVSIADANPNTLYCDECRILKRNQRNKANYEKRKNARQKVMAKCAMCGREIESGGNRKFCEECAKINAKQRQKKYQKETKKHSVGIVKFCKRCGRKFLSIHNTAFCGEICRREWNKNPATSRTLPQKQSYKGISIEELAVLAVQNGISYGKLVGRMEGRK